MTILDKITKQIAENLPDRKKSLPVARLQSEAEQVVKDKKPNRFSQALLAADMAIIAEVKKASPSKGIICPDFDPVSIAQEYHKAAVNAISVLTEENFFLGRLDYLKQISEITNLPLLRKDFIIDEYQIYEAAYYGASALLLITSVLSDAQLKDFRILCDELNLDALVEVHDLSEVEKASRSGAKIIGINNRNLKTFTVDLNTSLKYVSEIPESVVKVSESGIFSAQDIALLKNAGFNAVLIGESLMRKKDRAAFVNELRGNVCG